MATTIVDRLMHHAHLLEFEGKSYRLKEAASRLTGLQARRVKKPPGSGRLTRNRHVLPGGIALH
jgi:hypothetical protein